MSVGSRIKSNLFTHKSEIRHFIRIPLLNQTSSSQIQETLWQVANDPLAATVPPKAYQPLQSLSLSIASLSLKTEDNRNRATSLLQDLGNQDWRELFSKAQAARSNTRISSAANPETLSNDDRLGPRPLIVDVVGLGDSVFRHTPSNLESVMLLYIFIKEPMGLLETFCAGMLQKFLEAGLAKRNAFQGHREGFEFVQAKALSTRGLSSGVPCIKPTLKGLRRRDMVPRFDARYLCEKFKDVVWAKDVHLDRVCISERTPEDIFEDEQCIGTRYHDIASVPLPGVTWEPRSFENLRIPHRWATAEAEGRDWN